MQKLLRKSPSLGIIGSPPILSANFLFSRGFYKTLSPKLNCVSSPVRKFATMSSTAAATLRLQTAATNFTNKAAGVVVKAPLCAGLSKVVNPGGVCKCSVGVYGNRGVVGVGAVRAWVVLKESTMSGSRKAWFGTVGAGADKDAPVVESGEIGLEDKAAPVKVQRRQRASTAGASPDLLTIPGVGPRNLRKLVEKGFSGVAQLKQLYKDKVIFKNKKYILYFDPFFYMFAYFDVIRLLTIRYNVFLNL